MPHFCCASLVNDKQLTYEIIGAAIEVHRQLGPGLLESAYEECLCQELTIRNIPFERQKPLPLVYKELILDCGYPLDLLVGSKVVVEIKVIDSLAPIHDAIVLTYLKLSGCTLGLLINLHSLTLKTGVRRLVHNYSE